MKKLIYLFLFIQIFTNAFAISSVLSPAFAVSLILFGFGVLKGDVFKNAHEPLLLAGFYTVYFFSYVTMSTGDKCFNHLLMWSIPPFLYYYTFKREICRLFTIEDFEKKLLKATSLAVITASVFAIVEFLSVNVLGIDLSFIPRGTVDEYTPLALDSIRARSFMEESGQFSFFLEAFAPLTIYWLNRSVKSKILKWSLLGVMSVALFVSFSAAGYALFIMGGGIYVLYKIRSSGSFSHLMIVVILSAIVVIFFTVVYPEVFEAVSYIITSKIDPDNSSHSDRADRFVALHYFRGLSVVFGYGPAAFSTLHIDSFVSFYLGVLMSTGIVGAFFFTLFIIKQYCYLFSIRNCSLRITLIISLTMLVIHLFFVDNIYTPWLWVLLSFIYFVRTKQSTAYVNDKKMF